MYSITDITRIKKQKRMNGDTIVLKLTTHEPKESGKPNVPDTILYIFYDSVEQVYCLRGKRINGKKSSFSPFSMRVRYRDASSLYEFVKLLADDDQLDFSLLRYHSLPCNADSISYFLLADTETHEIIGFPTYSLTRIRFIDHLVMIADLYNPYSRYTGINAEIHNEVVAPVVIAPDIVDDEDAAEEEEEEEEEEEDEDEDEDEEDDEDEDEDYIDDDDDEDDDEEDDDDSEDDVRFC